VRKWPFPRIVFYSPKKAPLIRLRPRRVSVKLLRTVRTDTGFHTTWLMASNSQDLNSVDSSFFHAREGVPDTHSEYRLVETSASTGVGGAGPQTYCCCCSYRTAATPSQCVWLVCESSGRIFWPTFELNLHVALWAICWIVGLCNI